MFVNLLQKMDEKGFNLIILELYPYYLTFILFKGVEGPVNQQGLNIQRMKIVCICSDLIFFLLNF